MVRIPTYYLERALKCQKPWCIWPSRCTNYWGWEAYQPNIMFCILYSLNRSVPWGKVKTGSFTVWKATRSYLACLELLSLIHPTPACYEVHPSVLVLYQWKLRNLLIPPLHLDLSLRSTFKTKLSVQLAQGRTILPGQEKILLFPVATRTRSLLYLKVTAAAIAAAIFFSC